LIFKDISVIIVLYSPFTDTTNQGLADLFCTVSTQKPRHNVVPEMDNQPDSQRHRRQQNRQSTNGSACVFFHGIDQNKESGAANLASSF
jgi:hypothetical protein